MKYVFIISNHFNFLPQMEEKMEDLKVAEEDEAKEKVVSDDGVFTVSSF